MAKHQKYRAPIQNADTFPAPIAIGIKAFAITGSIIFLVQLLRGSAQSEGPDKAIYLFAILIAGLFLLLGFSKSAKASDKFIYGPLAFLMGSIGIAGIEQHAPINGVVLSNRLWLGFGPYVLILCLLIMPVAFRIIEWRSLKLVWRVILASLFTINLVLVIPSFWQSAGTVIDADHSEYVINELLAPTVGHWPYSDFIPQYQSFYGFLLNPFAASMSASQLSNLAFIGLTILTLLAIALGVFLAWIALGRRSLFLAVGLVVPFTGLTQFPNREGYLGSIAALLSGLSIRIFPGMALLGLLILLLRKTSTSKQSVKLIGFLSFGFTAGIVTWQSQDFGIAAVVTAFLVIAFAGSSKLIEFRSTLISLLAYIPGFALYPVIASLTGKSVNFDFFLFFARQFGSGFGAERMRTPGPVLYILPLLVMLVVVHGIYVYKSKKSSIDTAELSLSSLVGFVFGLWSLFGFTYYLNRSYASGQMQVLFLPLSVSVAALVGILITDSVKNAIVTTPSNGFFYSTKSIKSGNFAWLLPLLLIISLPFATLILTPNPSIEMKRIDEAKTAPRWPKPTILASTTDAIAAAKYAKENGLSIGFFGASANYVEKESGVKSVSILNSPFDLFMSQQTAQVSCDHIFKLNPDVLVVSDEGANLFQFEGKTLCNVYIQQDVPGVRSGHFAVKVTK